MVRIFLLAAVAVLLSCAKTDNITGGGDTMAYTSGLTWSFREQATHTKMNTMTANDDDLDRRVKLCLLAGANSTGVTRAVKGSKSGSISGSSAEITIAFSSDCDDGNPSFDGRVRVITSLEVVSGDELIMIHIKNVDEDGFTAKIIDLSGSGATSSFIIYFIAIGDID